MNGMLIARWPVADPNSRARAGELIFIHFGVAVKGERMVRAGALATKLLLPYVHGSQ